MGIWIRSQNKQRLSFCIEFYLQEKLRSSYAVIGCSKNSNGHIIGTYSTKEKALKVLDIIQKHIENVNYFEDARVGSDYAGVIAFPNFEVFQTPQNDAV